MGIFLSKLAGGPLGFFKEALNDQDQDNMIWSGDISLYVAREVIEG